MADILQITKDSILKAVETIDQNPNLRNGRASIEYDFVLDGKRYPPILVLSEANKLLGGSELLLSDFGNSTKKAFKIFEDLGYKVEKKYPILTKKVVDEIIDLCDKMATGRKNGSISQKNYTDVFRPFLVSFEHKFSYSPNLYLQNQLQNFYNANLKNVSDKLLFKSYGFWGRSIYNYTWSCIYYNFDKDSMQASYSPQLYILVNKEGIKFGFCYGHQVEPNNSMVSSALQGNTFSLLRKCLENDKDLCFFNSTTEEVTARPEKLFGKDEAILHSTDNDIRNNWSNKSLLIKEFAKNSIPENISEIIQDTFNNLKDFFFALLPLSHQNTLNIAKVSSTEIPFDIDSLYENIKLSKLHVSKNLVIRFISSLLTKPFVILTGLSGSGKTKLAQAFAKWICENKNQYCIIPVGADWTNREPILGFPNSLNPKDYKWDDYGALKLIIEAGKTENESKPYFLILDEMNLSHVERYFSDFLSLMESQNKIALHSSSDNWNGVPAEIGFPKNLFIVGTVNIDETTYMFSPKVLDRANVIEFRVTADEMKEFLQTNSNINIETLEGKGKEMAVSFVAIAQDSTLKLINANELNILMNFFTELKKTGAEFGYRSASEILRFIAVTDKLRTDWTREEMIDIAIMQKLLPKIHGSRRKLEPILKTLGSLCLNDAKEIEDLIPKIEVSDADTSKIKYPISFEKIHRMYHNILSNGFTSYAEA